MKDYFDVESLISSEDITHGDDVGDLEGKEKYVEQQTRFIEIVFTKTIVNKSQREKEP
jgi:hypothetical protein